MSILPIPWNISISTLTFSVIIPSSNMKSKASTFLKQVVVSVIVTIMKAKLMAVKSKTNAMKTRLLVFGFLRNKKVLMSAISHKIQALLSQEKGDNAESSEDNSRVIILYNENKEEMPLGQEEEEDDYPDLRHSLFDSDDDDELMNGTGSVIDLVRNALVDSADFTLEDEIDLVADVYIRRFHKQMKMQKLDSFKRYQEMLARGV